LRFLIALLLAATPALASDNDTIPGAREARHLIIPFIGYQVLNGEQRGVDYMLAFVLPSPDTTLNYNGSSRGQNDIKAPVLGLAYRYMLNQRWHLEGTISFIEDHTERTYPVILEVYGYLQNRNIRVQQGNTTALTADVCYVFDTPYKSITAAGRIGAGWAWRSVTALWEQPLTGVTGVKQSLKAFDPERLWSVRAGVDLVLWSETNLLIQGGVSYTQFIPINSDAKSFGGVGWRFSFFPIWSPN
jgi:hypothetical protein